MTWRLPCTGERGALALTLTLTLNLNLTLNLTFDLGLDPNPYLPQAVARVGENERAQGRHTHDMAEP